MDDLGISVFDAQGKFKGLDGVAGELHDAMSGLTEEERSEALGRIFGNEQLTAARCCTSRARGCQEVDRQGQRLRVRAEQAARLTDNLAGDIERLGGSISTVLIDGGSKATGVLRFLVQAATGGVNSIGDLPGPLQAVGVGLTRRGRRRHAAAGIVGTIIPRIQEARAALAALGPAGVKANAALGMIGKAGGGAARRWSGSRCCPTPTTRSTRRPRSSRLTRRS
jgi:hypothetical protein